MKARKLRQAIAIPSALVALVFGAACSGGGAGDAAAGVERLILISIDTLRADHLGAYGYSRPTSPELDAIAARGALFEEVSSPSPWTLPAHGSLLTGLYPSRHGLKSHQRFLPSQIETLASIFAKQGFRTAGAVNSHNLSSRFGLDRGFRDFDYVEETADQKSPTRKVTDRGMEWIAEAREGGERLFLFLHYYDVHTDYRSEEAYESEFVTPYGGGADGTTAQLVEVRNGNLTLDAADARHLIDLYDAGIRQMDAEIGRLADYLETEKLSSSTLLVITSDHGEEFLEHGGVLHGRTQFQEVLKVPLLMAGPGIAPGQRIETPVSLIDVMPTLVSRFGFDMGKIDGESLWPLVTRVTTTEEEAPAARSALSERYLFGEADHNNETYDMTRSVRFRNSKLVLNRFTGEQALYQLDTDPGETRDLSAERPRAARQLLDQLERFMKGGDVEAPGRELSPEELERLRTLGYLP